MNKMERDLRPEGLAELEYLDGEYRVVKAGSFVICAVTGVHVPVDALRYWSVDLQEAYANPAAALKRMQETGKTPNDSRRALLASGGALTVMAFSARATSSRVTLSGTMEQGSLIVGRTEPRARVLFDSDPLHVSPEGLFACGLEWNRTEAAHLSVQFADGTSESHEIAPVVRTYNVQHVNGLPPNTVTPPADVLERIHREAEMIGDARRKDSDAVWFAEPFDWPAPGIMSGVFGSQRIDNGQADVAAYGRRHGQYRRHADPCAGQCDRVDFGRLLSRWWFHAPRSRPWRLDQLPASKQTAGEAG